MIVEISKNFFETLLYNIIGIKIQMEDIKFYKFNILGSIFYATSTRTTSINTYPGLLLCEKRGSQYFLLPSVLEFIKNIPFLILNNSVYIKKITHGEAIPTEEYDGIYLLVDNLGLKLGLGLVENNQIQPLVDIGSYLRFESQ